MTRLAPTARDPASRRATEPLHDETRVSVSPGQLRLTGCQGTVPSAVTAVTARAEEPRLSSPTSKRGTVRAGAVLGAAVLLLVGATSPAVAGPSGPSPAKG